MEGTAMLVACGDMVCAGIFFGYLFPVSAV